MEISENLKTIRERVRISAKQANRDPAEITIIAVTKYVDVNRINQAIRYGITDIGENKVQDGLAKFPLLEKEVTKHLIGTLQTNKVKKALETFNLIHSVDREELIPELAEQARKLNRQCRFLIQVNVSGEATKHGVHPDKLWGLLELIGGFPNLDPAGLMTMAPFEASSAVTRSIFRRLRDLFEEVKNSSQLKPEASWHYLSMGMSRDFPEAVAEGANLLRIGTAIFQ
jgi:PLP dependent protein